LLVRTALGAGSASGSSPSTERYRHCDFSDVRSLAQAFRGCDAVVHLVGIIAEFRGNTFEEVHPNLTDRIVRACKESGIRRLIHMSALGTRPDARSRYHQTKWQSEQIVRESDLDWTIFRPSLIYGPRDSFTGLFARMSRWSPVLPAIGGGRNLMQPITVDAVGEAFAKAVDDPASFGKTYDLCGPERLTFRAILQGLLSAQERRRWILSIPIPVARAQAFVMETVWPRILRRPSPLNRDQILMLQEDNIGDGTSADAAFGLVHPRFCDALKGLLG